MFHVKHLEKKLSLTGLAMQQLKLLKAKLARHSIVLSETQMTCLYKYIEILLDWNKRTNLVSKRDESRIVKQHIGESLSVPYVIELPMGGKVMDLGSGAGFPGIPLKIIRPDLKMVLVESKRIKTLFLKEVAELLDLPGLEIIAERVEKLDIDRQKTFDAIIARAVTTIATLWKWSKPLIKTDGVLIAMKGAGVDEEIKNMRKIEKNVTIQQISIPAHFANTAKKRMLVVVREGVVK
jgi:16S rRNA (guanine527-N7)-methyltransferase